ncbi:chemotaxis protein [Actimicrobium sp. CCI2.3]|uniref:chemotaxis protein n=1 Tax=Actimicrobium sp. CCI2.3 TaxID=3048616 RepID=UPI002AB3861A|nr:chemotaxis protein [Actimicrobium sp. CCI2.3]MDY7574935.1 chemotaxis protein [Actimicrobium sp. CCI2.3]MEB0023333.1 chemotaxis protein [Actimicrobium sp. CCI2.3]
MKSVQQEVNERTNLTGSNQFELLLFRLGGDANGDRSELYGINVFKVREIVAMPELTAVAGAHPNLLGVVNLRGQIIPVIDLPALVGCHPKTGLNIMLVTEYARSTQAFAVEAVEEIVRLEWRQVLSAEASGVGGMITSIARLEAPNEPTRLAQVLDVEQILRHIMPSTSQDVDPETIGPKLLLKPGAVILAADDSQVARSLIEAGLNAIGAPFIMTKTGKEAWDKLQAMASAAEAEGKTIRDKVAMVLTDLEMPEMDGFTLTRNIKQSPRFADLPVVIHSSLSGSTNEDHVKSVGADAYVAKFVAEELAAAIRKVLA